MVSDRFPEEAGGQKLSPAINGLVLAGGKSTRMGMSKLNLRFHGVPQVNYCVEILSSVCRSVFISIRTDQRIEGEKWGAEVIEDLYEDSGPMSGLLSAFELHPEMAWLVLACDMPLVTRETLQDLVRSRDPNTYVTSFLTSEGGPEPLIAIYEPRCLCPLRECMQQKKRSLKAAIQRWGFHGVKERWPGELANVNTPEELQSAMERIARRETL